MPAPIIVICTAPKSVSYGPSNSNRPSGLRKDTWDFLPPKSIVQWSMAGSSSLRLERGNA